MGNKAFVFNKNSLTCLSYFIKFSMFNKILSALNFKEIQLNSKGHLRSLSAES